MDLKLNWKNSMLQALKDYCKNTSIHGYKYLVQPNRPKIEKFIWALILMTTLLMNVYMFHLLLDDFYNKVTITTLENTKHHISNVPFPGVAICNVNRISKKQVLKMTAELYQKMNISAEELFKLMKSFGKLYDFELDKITEMRKLQDIVDQHNPKANNSYESLMDILLNLSPTCAETLVKCKWMSKEIDCKDIFRTRRTMDGFCCTFNYVKTWKYFNLSSINAKLADYNTTELFFNGAGIENGLSVVVYSDPDDYYYPLISAEGFSVKIFNSHDYPDVASGALIESYIPLKHEVFMQIGATTVQAVPELRRTPVHERGCVFDNEGNTVFDSAFYSYSDCLSDCKLKSILALCECVPFFLPVLKSFAFSTQVCTVTDISCLSKHKDKWMNIYPRINIEELSIERENSLYCPQCLPSCFATSYEVDINQAVLFNLPYKDLQNADLQKYSIIHIFSDTEDTLLYVSNINYYWFDVISNFGGTCSLFLGFSLISVVEFFYFITVKYYRLLQNINNNKIQIIN